jgi:hypothetical protein
VTAPALRPEDLAGVTVDGLPRRRRPGRRWHPRGLFEGLAAPTPGRGSVFSGDGPALPDGQHRLFFREFGGGGVQMLIHDLARVVAAWPQLPEHLKAPAPKGNQSSRLNARENASGTGSAACRMVPSLRYIWHLGRVRELFPIPHRLMKTIIKNQTASPETGEAGLVAGWHKRATRGLP